ncbi:MAG TPA: ATP-binding protein, partial [Ktedonobacterales bacterium]|nr:ATP-binding protein [Ktedonobacterales bacterium]
GRGPGILASILAFLAYDFFFIPPLFKLTVDDPTEWLSLFALLAAALVGGHLTAAIQARAQEAIASRQQALASEQRTATLYHLAQLTASTPDEPALLAAVAERVAQVFDPAGVEACAVILPDSEGRPAVRAQMPAAGPFTDALSLTIREHAGQASWALERGAAVGGELHEHDTGQRDETESLVYFVPLKSGAKIVGLLGLAGKPAVRALVAATGPDQSASYAEPWAALFAAFCEQIALAIDRLALQREAVHAEALREGDQLKDALLGSVTHDLQTPLAAIQVAAESLLEPEMPWTDAERREFAQTIASSADRLGRLVSNLLDLSRLEAGVASPHKQWYPIGDVIATVLDRLDLVGRTAGRTVEVVVPDDVPAVPLDHAQIEEVLTNLIENALKYSPSEAPIQVRVRVVEETAEVDVRVTDQGIGIPPHELGLIFDKFYRVQHVELPWAMQRPPTGTGLGLAISAAIVEAHGGRIWAESHPGAGATVVFTLPLARGIGATTAVEPAAELAPSDRPMQTNERPRAVERQHKPDVRQTAADSGRGGRA